jgi:hypothetical protein
MKEFNPEELLSQKGTWSSQVSLNDKLAEVCGFVSDGQCYRGTDGSHKFCIEHWDARHNWNPTTDLNQLRECYLAAEKDWEEKNPEFRYRAHIHRQLKVIFGKEVAGAYDAVSDTELIDAWVKHPELVAQAILKAKGVDV